MQIEIYLLLYADVVSISPGVVLDEHHSLCEQAIQCYMNSKCCVQLCGVTSHAAKLFCLFLRGDGMTVFRLHPHQYLHSSASASDERRKGH